jgi:tetratricopeptide (TPR) repeat protein
MRGRSHLKNRHYDPAINDFNKAKASKDFYAALAIDSAFAPAYFARAHSWEKLGNLARALEDAKEALRLAPQTKKYEDLVFELRAKIKK